MDRKALIKTLNDLESLGFKSREPWTKEDTIGQLSKILKQVARQLYKVDKHDLQLDPDESKSNTF